MTDVKRCSCAFNGLIADVSPAHSKYDRVDIIYHKLKYK